MQSGLRICELIGALAPGSRPLEGKSFYLDEVKNRSSSILTELIGRLGGKVESFLNKDVSVVVTGNREAFSTKPVERSQAVLRKVKGEGDGSPAQRPGTPRPPVSGSRGKALLEKAIRSQEKSRASVLFNASSWGVKIVSLDEFLKFVDRLHVEITCLQRRRTEKKAQESSVPRVVKAGVLKEDFIKVEDASRKYRPLHMQSLPFPTLSYSGRFSPFETPAPPRPRARRDTLPSQDTASRRSGGLVSSGGKALAALPHTPSRRKKTGYCECCQTNYQHLDQHLESECHRAFVLDINSYAVVDQLVAVMDAGFLCCPDSVDATLALKLSDDCPATPLNPCTEGSEYTICESVKDLQIVTPVFDYMLSPTTADPASDLRPVLSVIPQPVEPRSDIPPPTPFEAMCVDDKASGCLPLLPHPETPVSTPSPEDSDRSAIPEYAPLSRITSTVPQPPTLAVKDPLVDDQERADPSHQSTLDQHKGVSVCLHDPKWSSSNVDHAGPLTTETLPLNVQLTECHQRAGGESLVDGPIASVPSRLSFPPSSVNLWVKVNPRKRCRSFPQGPLPSKKARKCSGQGLGPTTEKSVTNDCVSYVCAGPVPMLDERNDPVKQKPDTLTQDLLSGRLLAGQVGDLISVAAPSECLPLQQDTQEHCKTSEERVAQAPCLESDIVSAAPPVDPAPSSELGPPELHPFYCDDELRQELPPSCDPPTLLPSVVLPPPLDATSAAVRQASAASLLSHSFPSFCLESALIPSFTSSTSSESDWDSGLLSRLAPAVHLPSKGGRCELDLGLLLQRSYTGAQDRSYASQLCSVLQPAVHSPQGFGERINQTTLYRPIETMDIRITQSLGV